MHKLFSKYKKPLLLGIILIAAVFSIFILISNPEKSNETPTFDNNGLAQALSGLSAESSQPEDYESALSEFAESTNDPTEKAKAYLAIADFYSIRGDFRKELEYYKKSQSLIDDADLTQEEIDRINNSIAPLEYQVEVNGNDPRFLEGGFKEPDE